MSACCPRSTIRAPGGSSGISHKRSPTSGSSTPLSRLKPTRWGTHRPDRASRRRDMADPTARELKLIQYLNEAYGKEKQLETDLQRQIQLAKAKAPLKKRLTEHLRETKAQAKTLERRIKALGGKAQTADLPGPDAVSGAASSAASLANKALAAAKGPVAALRGTSPADNLLRNVRDAYWNEAEEIAHYNTIEAFADKLGDKETVKLAKEHRRQEQRMQKFLERQITTLVGEVIRSEIPARERKPAGSSSGTRRRSTSRKRATTRSSSSSSSRSSTSAKRAAAGAKGGRKTAAKRSSGSSSRSSGSGSGSRTTSRSSNGASASRSSGSSPPPPPPPSGRPPGGPRPRPPRQGPPAHKPHPPQAPPPPGLRRSP